jgi:secondary thiamine-phosphate synthase enzyme
MSRFYEQRFSQVKTFSEYTGVKSHYNVSMQALSFRSSRREEMIDITRVVAESVPAGTGVIVLFVQHTTCGMTVNENADPDVQSDMLGFLQRLIPQHEPQFRHGEENSDAHIKASIVGSSVTVPFENGKLMLGRWQGIYLCEFDGPRQRKVVLAIMKTNE